MVSRYGPGEPLIVAQSLPQHLERTRGDYTRPHDEELGSLTESKTDDDWLAEEDWLLREGQNTNHGSIQDNESTIRSDNVRVSRRPMRGRRQYGRLESTTVSSLTRLFSDSHDKEDNSSSEEEEPPIKVIYRRSGKDLAKLILLPTLYFSLMIVAIVFAFFTIEGLLNSYENKVRSVQSIHVPERYPKIGIAILPEFADYHHCEYRYYDDVSPHPKQLPEIFNKKTNCTYYNVTFNSTALKNVQRFAMVFEGPTLVACKESILIHYNINTTKREFSAVEYILFENWDHFESLSLSEKENFLARIEKDNTIYTFPAGFRTWVKMSYSVHSEYHSKRNKTDFSIIDNYAAYNDPGEEGEFPLEVVFEWKSPYYDYITEIVSTTAWSAFGSICGVFITLVKAAEFCRMWVRRIRRERQKKEAHLKQLEAEQNQRMEEYRQRQRERRETKLKKSLEATKSTLIQNNKSNFYD